MSDPATWSWPPDLAEASSRPADGADHDRTELLLSEHRSDLRAALTQAATGFDDTPAGRADAIDLALHAIAADLAAAFTVMFRYEGSPEGTRRWLERGYCHVDPGDFSHFNGVLVRDSESARRIATGEIVRADRSLWTPFDAAYVASLGARIGIVAPIAANGHLYGELRVGLRHTRELDADEIDMLRFAGSLLHRLATAGPLPPRARSVRVGTRRTAPLFALQTPPTQTPPAQALVAQAPQTVTDLAPESATDLAAAAGAGTRSLGVVRDFSNLITAIVGYAELLRARTGADEATHILSAARRAAALSSQLITAARALDPVSAPTASEQVPPTAAPSATDPATSMTPARSDAPRPTGAPGTSGAPAPASAAGSDRPAAPDGRKIVVLLVEDEDIVRAFTTRALERRGFDVLVAATPVEALEFASNGTHIDVLVSDVVMPGMNGTELATRFRSLHPDAGIVLTSGYPGGYVLPGGQVLAPGEAGQPNDIDFLGKPFEASTLVATIRANLARRGIGGEPDR